MNAYLKEVLIFLRYIWSWLLWLIAATAFFFLFGLRDVVIWRIPMTLPLPSESSFAVGLLKHMTGTLIPPEVTLVVTNPLAAFVAQIKIAFLLAFVVTLPLLITRLVRYFSPALYPHERRRVAAVAWPTALLFALGIVFSYLVLIPPTFAILYKYTAALGAEELFSVNEFLGLVSALVLATGVMFLLPVAMVLLSRLGLVSAGFWRAQWRYAVVVFLIVSAIITPDGSGITMALLSVPMGGLYLLGMTVSAKGGREGVPQRERRPILDVGP